jgi:hypothetical protein
MLSGTAAPELGGRSHYLDLLGVNFYHDNQWRHVGSGRAEWLREMSQELCLAVDAGIPLQGVCLYPILDRFDWDDPTHWHNSGLWDLVPDGDGTLKRVINREYADELAVSQRQLAAKGCGGRHGSG